MMKIAVAILLAVVPAAVYRSSVASGFVPVRVDLVHAELQPSNGVVKVALPNLSTFRSHTSVVLGASLRNDGTERREIGLSLHGLPKHRIALPPRRAVRRDIVLSPGIAQALGMDAGGTGSRTLQLTGDADGWALTGLEVRNYHARLGEGAVAAVLPARDAYPAGTGFLPVAIVLALLAFGQAFGPRLEARSARLIGVGLALPAFLVCVTCLVLPGISPYRLLLSTPAFLPVAAALFAPLLLTAVRPLVVRTGSLIRPSAAVAVVLRGAITRRTALVRRYWAAHATTLERGAALLALVAIGVAQPIFEVVSHSPEFFAARSTTPATLVAAVVAVGLGIPFVLLGIGRTIRVFNGAAAATFHGLLLALLATAIVMPWFRRSQVLSWPWDALVSAAFGLAVALAYRRRRIVRQFLTALAPAALVVPALFLLDPGVAQTFLPSESAAAVQTIDRTPPIVLVIFDELPLNSLLAADGEIDAERYPNFAALARDGYWFRNASSVSSGTTWAVPAILSGRYPTTIDAVPTLRYYPVNLFTVLARHYQIFATLRFRRLCPAQACQYNSAMPGDTVRSLLRDFGLVWLHIVLPQPLTEALPPVVGDWAEFGDAPAASTRNARNGRGGVFAEFLASIDGEPARLHVIHSMLPHMAFEYVPSGRRYRAPDYQTRTERGRRLFEAVSPAYADALHQRHLAQVGFVDRLIGDLILRLREAGAYDQALIVVTADHGASYREGQARRLPQEHNLSDIIQVPLVIKVPGQRGGEIVDRIVETVDILPTILDVVGAKASLRLDGRSLVDAGAPERASRTFILRNRSNVARRVVGDWSLDRAASLERKLRRFGTGDPMALYAIPAARGLLGTEASTTAIHAAPDVQIAIRDGQRFAAVDRDRDPLPLYVRGVVSTSRSDPLNVVVAVNGIVAAVTRSYRERGAHVFGTLIPEASLRDGRNRVEAFVVDALTANDPRPSSLAARAVASRDLR